MSFQQILFFLCLLLGAINIIQEGRRRRRELCETFVSTGGQFGDGHSTQPIVCLTSEEEEHALADENCPIRQLKEEAEGLISSLPDVAPDLDMLLKQCKRHLDFQNILGRLRAAGSELSPTGISCGSSDTEILLSHP